MRQPLPKLEKEIQKEVCQWLLEKGYFFWRSNNATSFKNRATNKDFTPNGIPDIIVLYNGDFFALEVKRPGASLRPEQVSFRDKVTAHGGFYYVITSPEDLNGLLA